MKGIEILSRFYFWIEDRKQKIIFCNCASITVLYRAMFFLFCLDGSTNIHLRFVAVDSPLTAFYSSRAAYASNKSVEN